VPLIRSVCALSAAWLLASAAGAAEVETGRMTWVEIRDAVAAGKTTILLPTGGTEQNGPHMVTGKHNFVLDETARRIAVKLGDALVAPVLPFVPEGDIAKREGHMAYAGTVSLTPEIFTAVLTAEAESFKAHGFKSIVFIGEHGASIEPQARLAARLSQAWSGDGVRVINAGTYYNGNGQVEWLKGRGETAAAIGVHATIQDTSELLAVYPAGVRLDKRAADKDGVKGDPTKATPEIGAAMLDLKVDAAVKEIEAAKRAPLMKSDPPDPVAHRGLLSRAWHWFFG
jgi:creatinine amidohydrolase/Fe(II)-dependent formamide hydrolase-like protein